MTTQTNEPQEKIIAYWPDGYFIADDDAAEQAEILDSVNAFHGEHKLLSVPKGADHEAMEAQVKTKLSAVNI